MVPVTTNQYINPHVSRLDGWLYPHQYIHHMDIVIYLDNSLGYIIHLTIVITCYNNQKPYNVRPPR